MYSHAPASIVKSCRKAGIMQKTKTTRLRKLSIYGFELVRGGHNFYALLDIDITGLRRHLREKRRQGEGGSLFSLILKAIGSCLQEYPEFNAMINLKHTSYFDQVDVNIPIEVEHQGTVQPKQYIIRDINSKTLAEVDKEIHASKISENVEQGYIFSGFLQRLITVLPKGFVLFMFRSILSDHKLVRKLSGTIFVTSVSMFSNVPGYVIPYIGGPKAVSFALGSSTKKPVVIGNEVKIREIMNATVVFNHDLIDGAQAARFINRFREYLERSYDELM
jgi:pyruvate/2-oxoglutarate dehydrogenase complex dihydrolipoamide acyltransferase (E2) component